MKLVDCRRLTGPSIVWRLPGSIADVECAAEMIEPLSLAWRKYARKMLDAVGWYEGRTQTHVFSYGVSLALSSPIDAMYAATELNEWAYHAAAKELTGIDEEFVPFAEALVSIQDAISEEVNPRLISLKSQADSLKVAFLSDDDEVSLGFGRYSSTWPVTEIPDIDSVSWSQHKRVPVGLVTGTNGKTTSVRLAVKMARVAGHQVGLSSTDWVAVNDRVIDRGDYSGPGGARTVLRDKEVDIAILETARGGLLRRGLGVERADAALITNIAEDHLGDFGSKSVSELLDVKWVVSSVLDDSGMLILNADDARLVDKAKYFDAPIAWFSTQQDNPLLQSHVSQGGKAATVREGTLSIYHESMWHDVCPLSEIPITLAGIAKHNVSNSLGAALLSHSLGIDLDHVAQGLRDTQANDNPGRCNVFQHKGATVLVDFAHNPDGMQAIFDVAVQLPAKRRILCFAQAGDRTDEQIRELAGVAWRMGLDQVHVSELSKYARGREPKEVFGLLQQGLKDAGASADQIVHFEEELDAFDAALAWAQPGDLVIMLALGSGSEILSRMQNCD